MFDVTFVSNAGIGIARVIIYHYRLLLMHFCSNLLNAVFSISCNKYIPPKISYAC